MQILLLDGTSLCLSAEAATPRIQYFTQSAASMAFQGFCRVKITILLFPDA